MLAALSVCLTVTAKRTGSPSLTLLLLAGALVVEVRAVAAVLGVIGLTSLAKILVVAHLLKPHSQPLLALLILLQLELGALTRSTQ